MAPGAFQELQMLQLENLLRFTGKHAPFYRDSLKFLDKLPKRGLYEQHLAYLPVLSCTDLQKYGQKFIVRRPLPGHGKARLIPYPKRPGPPVRIMATGLLDAWNRALDLRSQDWHGIDASSVHLDICNLNKQQEKVDEQWSALPWSGPLNTLSIDLPVEDLFEEFLRVEPDYLRTLPGILQSFVELSISRGLKPLNLRQVHCRGEYLNPEIRKMAEKTWGVPIIHEYAVEEIGVIAIQCPDNDHLHIQSEFVHVEVLDDDDQPCRAGQTGRVVVTPLRNYQTPLIRYDTGNNAEIGALCSCGRTLPVLTRILKR
jgi:phenylacetate-CoA ligase